MRIRCKYSNEIFRVEHFDNYNFVDQHPIFSLSARDLLVRARDWSKMTFTDTENKLLFLALLNRTESILFTHYADPEPKTVARNMQSLFKLLGSYDLIQDGTIILPKYAISADNYKLDNIHNWINAWNEAKTDWLNPISRFHIRASLKNRELVLDKLMQSPGKTTDQYSGKLAAWAMVAANVPENLRVYWTTLFKLKGDEIYSARLSDLEELFKYMESKLYAVIKNRSGYLPYANVCLTHLRGILAKAKNGRIGDLGGPMFSILGDDEIVLTNIYSRSAYQPTNIALHNAKLLAIGAPENEPTMAEFKGNILAYARARASWTVSQNVKNASEVKDTMNYGKY